jgi:hypothetical protein
MRVILSNLLNISIVLFLITFVFALFSGKFNYVAYVLMVTILLSLASLFIFKIKNKNIHFLILSALISLFFISFLNQKYIKNEIVIKNKIDTETNIASAKNIKEASTESLIQDIQIDIKNNVDKEIVKEKIIYTIQKAEERKDKNISSTYLTLGHTYEIAFISGFPNSGSKALEAYNQYCLLDPNNTNCYATIARFLILDKNRKKEAIVFAKKALELAKDEQETENYNKLLNYIENL